VTWGTRPLMAVKTLPASARPKFAWAQPTPAISVALWVPQRTASRMTTGGPLTTIANQKWTSCSPCGNPSRSHCGDSQAWTERDIHRAL
jgi:hypothetical protein